MIVPTLILAIPGVGRLYEKGKQAELEKPIDYRPNTGEDANAPDMTGSVADGIRATLNGARLTVAETIQDAKGDAFKAVLLLVGVGLVVYWFVRKVSK